MVVGTDGGENQQGTVKERDVERGHFSGSRFQSVKEEDQLGRRKFEIQAQIHLCLTRRQAIRQVMREISTSRGDWWEKVRKKSEIQDGAKRNTTATQCKVDRVLKNAGTPRA